MTDKFVLVTHLRKGWCHPHNPPISEGHGKNVLKYFTLGKKLPCLQQHIPKIEVTKGKDKK